MSKAFKLIKKYSLSIILLLCLVVGYQYFLVIGYKDNITSVNTFQYLQAKRTISDLKINLINDDSKTGDYLNEARSDLSSVTTTIVVNINPDAHRVVDNVYRYILSLQDAHRLHPNEIDLNPVLSQLNELEKQMEPAFWRVGKNSKLVLTEEQKNAILEMTSDWIEVLHTTSLRSLDAQKPQGIEYQPTITADVDEALEKVAFILMDKYLTYYKGESIPEVERVKDYIIDDIVILKETDSAFVFTVAFSVQGVSDATAWKTGNGMVTDHGWIEDKFMFVHVIQEGHSYTMVDWNTGGYGV